ncbi:MAG TPA: hypothetical protein VMV74_11270 [Bacteroidales bacterium]|nr:hypothetical protein [Bacteroidales bacterium]
MKKSVILFLSLLCAAEIYSQSVPANQLGSITVENLKAISNISPYTPGAVGFDNRYLGVKGTTRLFDTLTTSFFLVSGQKEYIPLNSDIDVMSNALVFIQSGTGELMEISSDHIDEVIFKREGGDLYFRTTRGIKFEKEFEGNKFYEVLKEGPYTFIVIHDKKLVEADYQRLYSPDRRYDELKPVNKYYIAGSDGIFYRVQLNAKSLAKLFPDKKELIRKALISKDEAEAEAQIIALLNKF